MDSLRRADPASLERQEQELRDARYDSSDEFVTGYLLGLQTARAVLRLDPALVKAGINVENVL